MLGRLTDRLKEISSSAKNGIALSLCSVFIVATCCSFAYATPNSVTIYDAENAPIHVKTTSANVGKVLSKQGIVLSDGDKMNISLNEEIKDNTVIEIYRSNPVNVTYHGETKEYQTTKKLVSDVLYEIGITVDADDVVSPRLTDTIEAGDTISIVVTDTQSVTVQEDIPFTSSERENAALAPGQRVVAQAGVNGVKESEYAITYQDGIEVSRELVRETVLSQPVAEIVEYGPEDVWQLGAIPASKPIRFSKMEVFEATAYDASPADNGKWAGKTSTGMPLTYGVVAVDPRVIPYGTKMYIESVDGQYVYGYAIAGDCGGAIKNKRVDLFFDSRATCNQFGRRAVNIYFLD